MLFVYTWSSHISVFLLFFIINGFGDAACPKLRVLDNKYANEDVEMKPTVRLERADSQEETKILVDLQMPLINNVTLKNSENDNTEDIQTIKNKKDTQEKIVLVPQIPKKDNVLARNFENDNTKDTQAMKGEEETIVSLRNSDELTDKNIQEPVVEMQDEDGKTSTLSLRKINSPQEQSKTKQELNEGRIISFRNLDTNFTDADKKSRLENKGNISSNVEKANEKNQSISITKPADDEVITENKAAVPQSRCSCSEMDTSDASSSVNQEKQFKDNDKLLKLESMILNQPEFESKNLNNEDSFETGLTTIVGDESIKEDNPVGVDLVPETVNFTDDDILLETKLDHPTDLNYIDENRNFNYQPEIKNLFNWNKLKSNTNGTDEKNSQLQSGISSSDGTSGQDNAASLFFDDTKYLSEQAKNSASPEKQLKNYEEGFKKTQELESSQQKSNVNQLQSVFRGFKENDESDARNIADIKLLCLDLSKLNWIKPPGFLPEPRSTTDNSYLLNYQLIYPTYKPMQKYYPYNSNYYGYPNYRAWNSFSPKPFLPYGNGLLQKNNVQNLNVKVPVEGNKMKSNFNVTPCCQNEAIAKRNYQQTSNRRILTDQKNIIKFYPPMYKLLQPQYAASLIKPSFLNPFYI